MSNQTVTFNTRRPFGTVRGGRPTLRQLSDWLNEVAGTAVQSDSVILSFQEAVALGDLSVAGPSVGLLTLSGGAGAVGATIDGTLVTAAFATSDAVTMTAVMAAIRANASVNRKVTAVNRVARMTLASVLAGTTVNVFGTVFTAVNGAPTALGQFDMSGADAADATSLALAINRHPSLSGRYRAVANAAVVNIGLLEDRAPTTEELITNPSAATITINVAAPTVGAFGLIFAMVPGALGDCCTVVASGTGMSYATANAGKLGGGTGGGSTQVVVVP